MKRKQKNPLLPVVLLSAVVVLSIGALILAQKLRRAEIENPRKYTDQDQIPRVTINEANQAMLDGEAIIVDTRSESQYQVSHIAGAINVPVDQVEDRLGELDPDQWYITYCT